MSESAATVCDTPSSATTRVVDDGRNRMVTNVLASWGGQLIRIASGFLMPRLIDHHIGQEALGVWDVSWSIIAHLSLVQAGVSGSVNRYVARYRTNGSTNDINRAVSSVAAVLRAMGALVLLLAVVCVVFLDRILGASFHAHIVEARWLVFLLGVSTAVQLSTGMYGGVITGYHRWDLHNYVYAITNTVMLVGGAVVLMCGGGLIGLAVTSVTSEFLGRVMRWHYSKRLCPSLEISRKHMQWKTAREMMRFGSKMFLVQISQLVLNQTINILVALHFGPAAIALFARPSALLRHVEAISGKYANVLVPTAGVVQTSGDRAAQQELAVASSRVGMFLCLPIVLFLAILGDDLIHLWMGAKYVQSGLTLALSVGWFFYLANIPLFNVLSGFNMHGKTALANVIAAGIAIPSTWIAIALDQSLVVVAIANIFPVAVMNGLWMPLHACKRLELSPRSYFRQVWTAPILSALPFVVCLLAAKILFRHNPVAAVLFGAGVGGGVLATCYWFVAVPPHVKSKLKMKLKRRGLVPA